ncbi:monovalent cation/H+ antiporter subunit D family protein [Salinimonas marina]|uniref:Monovalent cation/H+ antiporter subunit D family protein n=1 Tax=Salinimonas marina TaxID=2785918 RepID=A0A7S9DZ73_9ALTE|nr:monovalent cation/H+ antiporter subunit D family protein [Salinimonas marina]QPG06642.1 monovalent cation/H+ antiporter subunit D family protein [Salinimonas marina]
MELFTVLLVVIPLISAPITAMIANRQVAWTITLVTCLALAVLSAIVLQHVISGEVIHYELGGWKPPWGIEYVIDSLNALVAVIVAFIALISVIYGSKSVQQEIDDSQIHLFYAAFQLVILGLMGMALTGDIFNLFVFLEISSLSSYALIAMGQKRQALVASFNYLMAGTLGATFFLLGIGFLYAASGTLNMADIAARFDDYSSMTLVLTALLFMLIGLTLKAAAFPLHSWLPEAYTQAPTMVTVFLASTSTKVAIYVLIRTLYHVFPSAYWADMLLPGLLLLSGCLGMLYGSYKALCQISIKRLLAYSSVAQLGYMVVGVGLNNEAGLIAATVHMFNHAITKAALFMAAGLVLMRLHTTNLEKLRGAGKTMPWTTGAFALAGLSLIGVPGTAGFVSKWYLVQGALENDNYIVAGSILVASIMAIMYVWKIIEALYFDGPQKLTVHKVGSGKEIVPELPVATCCCYLMVVACFYFGLYTAIPLEAANTAVEVLFRSGGGQ